MGFFQRLFGAKPAAQVESVPLAGLRDWYLSKRKDLYETAQHDLDRSAPELRAAIDELGKGIDALRSAGLLNPKIQERERHFLDGNRDQFLKAAERFLRSITPPATPEELPSFDQHVQQRVKQFSEDIQRAFQILQNFLANETKELVRQVDAIAKHATALRGIRRRLDGLDALGTAIDDLSRAISDQQRDSEETRSREERGERLRTELKQAQDAVSSIESSPEHKELVRLKSQTQDVANKLKTFRQGMLEQFSAIEPALKKYERMTMHHQLVKDYLANPIETLARDRGLQLLHILVAMRKEVVADRIELKDKKKEKVLTAMDAFNSATLSAFLKDYGNLTQTQIKLLGQADLLPVLHDLAAAKERVQRVTRDLSETEQKSAMRSAQTGEENITGMRRRVIDVAHGCGINLRIN
ncbi:hypothetical protein HY493_02795 [Candidatus Woesearchaeota archaeon]|nr:hypothetical protein [Candidatus Woesearchaeota archaeon]